MATYDVDQELEESTNNVMLIGFVLLLLLILAFPLYRWVEPVNRDEARESNLASLAESGEDVWGFNCGSCHGLNGEGGLGPALNSIQYLEAATDDQSAQLIAVGVPGSQMGAYSQDFGGPLTSEQIKAITTYIRSWEDGAPDNPSWRLGAEGNPALATDDLSGPELYAVACAACHGDDLSGTEDFPSLGRGSDASEETDERLERRIVEGQGVMPAFGDRLSDEQVASLVAYIREVQAGTA